MPDFFFKWWWPLAATALLFQSVMSSSNASAPVSLQNATRSSVISDAFSSPQICQRDDWRLKNGVLWLWNPIAVGLALLFCFVFSDLSWIKTSFPTFKKRKSCSLLVPIGRFHSCTVFYFNQVRVSLVSFLFCCCCCCCCDVGLFMIFRGKCRESLSIAAAAGFQSTCWGACDLFFVSLLCCIYSFLLRFVFVLMCIFFLRSIQRFIEHFDGSNLGKKWQCFAQSVDWIGNEFPAGSTGIHWSSW